MLAVKEVATVGPAFGTSASIPTLWTELQQPHQEDRMPLTFYALIKLANGNQQRVQVVADTWANARLMIEAQFGRGVIISGPHQL